MYIQKDDNQNLGIAPIIPIAAAALPTVANIFGNLFGKKKKVTPPPAPPKPAVPQWVWIAGVGFVAIAGTAIVFGALRKRRR